MSGRSTAGSRSRWLPWTVLVGASLLLVGSVTLLASGLGRSASQVAGNPSLPGGYGGQPATGRGPAGGTRTGPGGMMGNGAGNPMMGGRVWLAGNGTPVNTIAAARARAVEASAPGGLHPGEVMQFSLNFYVELKDAAGAPVTEVLVDPADGTVVTEYGPAMMWTNGSSAAAIPADRATTIANQWLQANAPGETIDSTDLYPGHFTMDTVSGGNTVGMLSVNATTGAVWYHTWHGTFIAKEDA
ncbi:MAG: hypothetical protein ACOH1Y_12995 [Propionicimonas sp.]